MYQDLNPNLHKLVQLLEERGFVGTAELYNTLGVSRSTLHRYLNELNDRNIVRLVRGGAIYAVRQTDELPGLSQYENMDDPLYAGRQRIGRAACSLIDDREGVILGTGHTNFALAKCLATHKKKVHVYTCALTTAFLLKNSQCELTVFGGVPIGEEGYLVDPSFLQGGKGVPTQKIFIGAGGISAKNGIMNHNSLIVETEKKLAENAREIILLASSIKFNMLAPYVIAPLEAVTTVITDAEPSEDYTAFFKAKGIRLIIA